MGQRKKKDKRTIKEYVRKQEHRKGNQVAEGVPTTQVLSNNSQNQAEKNGKGRGRQGQQATTDKSQGQKTKQGKIPRK